MINTDGKPTVANYPLKMGRDVQVAPPSPEAQTVDITPNWEGMRRWVKAIAQTDLKQALKINVELGCEGIDQSELLAASE